MRASALVDYDIATDTVWTKDEGPYLLEDTVLIQPGVVLVIEPGAVVEMSGAPFVVYGALRVGNAGTSSLDRAVFEGPFSLVSFGGTVDIFRTNITGSSFMIFDENSSFASNYSEISGGYINVVGQSKVLFSSTTLNNIAEIRIFDQGLAQFNDSIITGSEGFLLKSQSRASFKNTHISEVFADNAFSVQQQSEIHFENSDISPFFSNFALLLDGSKMFATSTRINNLAEYGVEAVRNSVLTFEDVSMTDIIATNPFGSFFIELVGSTAHIHDSRFAGTPGNVIELYGSGAIPYSTLNMHNSHLADYGEAGIYAVYATGTVTHSIFEQGSRGIENIFSYLSISNSRISENAEYNAVAYVSTQPLHAENNYWGDVSGPGDTISSNVLAYPWLATDPTLICCSSVMFLPGLMASRLYSTAENGDEVRMWEPATLGGGRIKKLFLDDKGKSIEPGIYARDIINEAIVSGVGPNIYKSFIGDMDKLKSSGAISDWKSVPYDWRLSLDDILDSVNISGELEQLAQNSKTGKVTVIAHSNGGLLAKALLLRLHDVGLEYLVDKLIMVAVPQIGTPQAVGALLHGFGQGIPKQLPIFATPKLMRTLGLNMPGAYGLVPSSLYFESVSDPVITPGLLNASTTLFDFLKPFVNSYLLTQAQSLHAVLDTWIPNPTLRVIQIAGWGIDTLKGLRYYNVLKKGVSVERYEPLFTEDGDETVVVPSALVMSTTTPHVERYWLNLEKANESEFPDRSHADILEVADMRSFIKNNITGTGNNLPPSISTTSPPSVYGNKLQFLLYGGSADVHLYDAEGNHTGLSTSTGLIEQNIPDTFYRDMGDVIYISVPQQALNRRGKSSAPHVVVNYVQPVVSEFDDEPELIDDTFTLEVSEMVGTTKATSTSFIDVPITESTVSSLEIYPEVSGLESLHVDIENDGVIDFKVQPNETVGTSHAVKVNRAPRSGGRARNLTISTTTTTVSPVRNILVQVTATATNAVKPRVEIKSQIVPNNTASVFGALEEGGTRHFLYGVMSRIRDFIKSIVLRLSA